MPIVDGLRRVALSRPSLGTQEIEAVGAVLRSGQLAQGEVVAEFERCFAAYIGARFAIATTSGTTALQLALLAHGIGAGDEVITTPFTFIASANAILMAGARPVFADIDPMTLNISPAAIEQEITPRTKAILPVHLYGNPCDIGALVAIARRHNLIIIEDACQAHGACYGGRRIGSLNTSTFSFYPTKNMTAGEGGMVTTNDPDVADRARLLREHGSRVRYRHEIVGYNFRMTEIHAAIGLCQLGRLDEYNAARALNAAFYNAAFIAEPAMRTVCVTKGALSAWHQYSVMVEPGRRDALAEHLKADGVGAGVYYPIPIHRQQAYLNLGITGDCPNADLAAASVLSIPVHPGVGALDREYVVDAVTAALTGEADR